MRRPARAISWIICLCVLLAGGLAVAQKTQPPTKKTEKKKKKKTLKIGPTATLDSFQGKMLLDAKVRQAQEQISQLRTQQIISLKNILSTARNIEDKGRIYFQLGELLWQEKKYRYLLSYNSYEKELQAYEEKRLPTKPNEPSESYGEALKYYRLVLKEAPNYKRIDEVMYYLGRALLKTKDKTQQKEGVERLKTLTKKHTSSRLVPEAHLQMAEWMFKNKNLGGAQYHYERLVNNYASHKIFNYALYKLGWVYYNLGEYAKSITTLKRVVSSIPTVTTGMIAFREQAIKDMVVIHTKIDDGWQKLRSYLEPLIGAKKTYEYLERMAELYVGNDQDEDAVALLSHFIKRTPADPKVVGWWETIVDVKKKPAVFAVTEKAMREMIAFLDPKGSWIAANRNRTKLVEKATNMCATALAFIGTTYHVQAQKGSDKALYRKAADTYKEYFEKYPKRKRAYELNFYYAEILLEELKQTDAAIAQYRKVIELDGKGEYLSKAAEGMLYAYYDKMVKAGLRQAIYKKRKRTLIKKGKFVNAKDSRQSIKVQNREKDTIKVKPLHSLEREYIKAADLYVKLLPKDKRVPEMMYIAGETLYRNGQWQDAIQRFIKVIDAHGTDKYAAFAANALFDCYRRLSDWRNLEKWAKVLISKGNFKVKSRGQLQKYVAIARTEVAASFEKEKRYDSAVKTLDTIIRDFAGNQEVLEKTIFNKAELLLRAKRVDAAITTFKDFLRRFRKSEFTPRAMTRVAMIYESQTEFSDAAKSFEQASELYGKFKRYKGTKWAADSLYNAGLIYKAVKDWKNAARVYQMYVRRFPKRKDATMVKLEIGYILEARKDWGAAAKQYLKLTRDAKFKQSNAHMVEAFARAGRALRQQSAKRNRRKAIKLFDLSVKTFAAMSSAKAKSIKYAQRYAALAAFEKTEFIFGDFGEIKLQLPLAKLSKLLTKRVKLLGEARKGYFKVLDLKYGQYSAAAAYRIGQMYYDFAESLFNVPVPKNLTDDQKDKYQTFLEDKAGPLRDNALKAFRTALQLAHKNRVYNKWSLLSGKYLTKLSPESFPLAKEDAVSPKFKRDIISSGNLIRNIKRGEFTVNFSKP